MMAGKLGGGKVKLEAWQVKEPNEIQQTALLVFMTYMVIY